MFQAVLSYFGFFGGVIFAVFVAVFFWLFLGPVGLWDISKPSLFNFVFFFEPLLYLCDHFGVDTGTGVAASTGMDAAAGTPLGALKVRPGDAGR